MPSSSTPPPMEGWELAALFLIFLSVTVVWELLVGVLTFLNNILRGRKANWLHRVKEELLALGVVSLVLLFLEPTLQQICTADHSSSSDSSYYPSPPPVPADCPECPECPTAYGYYSCPEGQRQVFPRSVIHGAHYLLFYLAIIHILFSLVTSVVTNVKLAKYSVLERTSRKEANIPQVAYLRLSSTVTRMNMEEKRLILRVRNLWRDFTGYVDQDLYSLLRFMAERRFAAHRVVLRNFNFLNMCEQCLEAELNHVYSHAWLLVFMMAILLLFNRIIYQIVWITAVCLCLLLFMSGNLRWVLKKTAREAQALWRATQEMKELKAMQQEEGADGAVAVSDNPLYGEAAGPSPRPTANGHSHLNGGTSTLYQRRPSANGAGASAGASAPADAGVSRHDEEGGSTPMLGGKHGHGHKHSHKHGHGHGDEDDEVHSETSEREHELAAGIEEKITRLFFFGKPGLLPWVFNVIFAQASLTMTMSAAFIIPYDKFDAINDVAQSMYIWLPMVIVNMALVFYGCWVFLPQFALAATCGVLEPHEVMDEIKKSKTQDDAEHGLAGFVLESLTGYFIGKHEGETTLSTAFIVALADQAGIILGRDYKAGKQFNRTVLKPVYREMIMVWHDVAWYGELREPYRMKADTTLFREAFDELDEDGSGALSFGELANMIRSLGTYATTGDVEAMLWEIDIDNSKSIGFDEFIKFVTYSFIDTQALGYIDLANLLDAMERLAMPITEMQAMVLMGVGHMLPGEEVRVTLRQFFEMYDKVTFEDVPESSEESNKGSMMGRALSVLREPSRMMMRVFGTKPAGGAVTPSAGSSSAQLANPPQQTSSGRALYVGGNSERALQAANSGSLAYSYQVGSPPTTLTGQQVVGRRAPAELG